MTPKKKSAKGSEKFQWNLFPPDTIRVCWKCGKEPLRVDDVAEHRRVYPNGLDEFLCKDCMKKKLEKAVDEHRKRIGLQPLNREMGGGTKSG